MPAKLPVSAFIIAQNEADRIGVAIESVRGWVEEVIVIDSGSADDTMKIAEALGARVFFHSWQGYGLQRRFGEEQCKSRWLLAIDADEEIAPGLAEEIKALFENGEPAYAAYRLRISDVLPGEKSLSPFAHTNRVIRLYDKTRARFSENPVHDSVIVAGGGAIGELKSPALHRSFRSLAHAIEKMNSYSSAQAENLRNGKGLAFPYLRLCVELPFAFLKIYFLRGYILRGWRGLAYSLVYAFGRFIRVAKYMEHP